MLATRRAFLSYWLRIVLWSGSRLRRSNHPSWVPESESITPTLTETLSNMKFSQRAPNFLVCGLLPLFREHRQYLISQLDRAASSQIYSQFRSEEPHRGCAFRPLDT